MLGLLAAWSVTNLVILATREAEPLQVAWSVPDRGGYCALNDSGVPSTIRHEGSIVLPASKGGTYCCGFTFMIAMSVAEDRGLLAGKSIADVRKFQRAWYGSERGTEVSQCAGAVEALGIGKSVSMEEARPGDFVCFNRVTKIGHSVVLLDWLYDDSGHIVGVHYRSSQPSTGGVGNAFEYFSDTGMGKIDRASVRIARLHHRTMRRVLFPFD